MNTVARTVRSGNNIYVLGRHGRLMAVVSDPTPPALEPHGSGFSYVADGNFPRTCMSFLPRTMPVDADLDNDGRNDARIILEVTVLDVNGDGVPNEGDLVCLSPRECRIVGFSTRMVLSESTLRELCERVAKSL